MEEKNTPCDMETQDPKQTEPKAQTEVMSTKKLVAVVSSPLWFPCLMVPVMMLAMFIGCGWMFVAMTFFTSAAAAAVGICGVIGAFFNIANGAGAVLLSLGCGLIGLGLIFPVFCIGKEFFKSFLTLSKEIFRKLKDLKSKAVKK